MIYSGIYPVKCIWSESHRTTDSHLSCLAFSLNLPLSVYHSYLICAARLCVCVFVINCQMHCVDTFEISTMNGSARFCQRAMHWTIALSLSISLSLSLSRSSSLTHPTIYRTITRTTITIGISNGDSNKQQTSTTSKGYKLKTKLQHTQQLTWKLSIRHIVTATLLYSDFKLSLRYGITGFCALAYRRIVSNYKMQLSGFGMYFLFSVVVVVEFSNVRWQRLVFYWHKSIELQDYIYPPEWFTFRTHRNAKAKHTHITQYRGEHADTGFG